MSKCSVESWKMKEIASALKDMNHNGKKIVIPRFQRGKRWTESQELAFIDSLKRGYPVGTLLFYKTNEVVSGEAIEVYTLVDGLQRSTAISRYLSEPMKYFEEDNVPDELLDKICGILGFQPDNVAVRSRSKAIYYEFIKGLSTLEGEHSYNLAVKIVSEIESTKEQMAIVQELMKVLPDYLSEFKKDFEIISETEIPAVVYSGPEEELPKIFERINSKGTPLNPYEIYAASWPQTEKFVINNSKLIDHVLKKYDSLNDDIYTIKGYDRSEISVQKKLTIFEYCFGLSKWLTAEFPILSFEKKDKVDEISTIGFELLDACVFESKNVGELHTEIVKYDINRLEKCLVDAITIVGEIITPIIRFKGNSRKEDKSILYSKNQIVSMIAFVFREKYNLDDLAKINDDWDGKKDELKSKLYLWFVYDILRKEWFEGGGKVHSVINSKKYYDPISPAAWDSALDGMFEESLSKKEIKNVKNPSNVDIVFLNAIYVSKFSAMDQLSSDKFDIEHIAPKDLMKRFIKDACPDDYLEGLPIGSIANLCYLPEYQNRSKGNKTFYQDTDYLNGLTISDIEDKYSFTTKESLDWADLEYDKGDFDVLRELYLEFLTNRFERQKHEFFVAMGIDEADIIKAPSEKTVTAKTPKGKKAKEKTKVIKKKDEPYDEIKNTLEKAMNVTLTDEEKTVVSCNDKRFIMAYSKMYPQGKRHKYWFAFRPQKANAGTQLEKYHVFACNDDKTLFSIPVEVLNQQIHSLNSSKDSKQNTYYHIVLFVDTMDDGSKKTTWLLSRPSLREMDIKEYII